MSHLKEENNDLRAKLSFKSTAQNPSFLQEDPTITMEGKQISNPANISLGALDGKVYTMGKKQVGIFSLHFNEYGGGSFFNCELQDAKLQVAKGAFVGRKYFKDVSWDGETRTFKGTLSFGDKKRFPVVSLQKSWRGIDKPMAESGSHKWEYILTFTPDFRFVQSGIKQRTVRYKDENGDEQENTTTIEICSLDEEGKASLTPDTQYKLHSSVPLDMSYTQDTIDRMYEYD